MVLIIRRSDLNVVITLVNGKFDIEGCIFWLENSFFAFQFVNMLAEYFFQKGVCTSFFTGTFRPIEDHMLKITKESTGKSLVSAS
jgi:hypothetical protein